MITAEDRGKIIKAFYDTEIMVPEILDKTTINIGIIAEKVLDDLYGKVQTTTLEVQDLIFEPCGGIDNG